MKNNEILNEALGKIDDKMIAAAYERQAEKMSLAQIIGKITAVAAVAAFAAFAILFPIMAKRAPAPVSPETSYTAKQPYDTKSDITLASIYTAREIPGGWGYVSVAEDESYSYAEIKLSELLKSASVAYSLPSLIPEGYVVTHTDMTGSINSPEEAQSLSLCLIDNVNNVIREERDEEGNVVFNTNKYNGISIELYKKSFWENTGYGDFLKEKWSIEYDLSEDGIGKKYDAESGVYKFEIETGEYYVLYTFKEAEGGERDLGTSEIYRIVASTPYIKDNGYKESETTSDPVSTTPAERKTEFVDISEIKEITGNYGWSSTGADDWRSAAVGMKLKDMLKIQSISECLPTLMPKDYLVMHIGMAGSVENAEDARDISFQFIDNANKVVEEERDQDGNIVYNKKTYNWLGITLYKKDAYEGTDYITQLVKKNKINGELSAKSIGEKRIDSNDGYSFLIETDKYCVLYEYRGFEGGERDLSTSDIYRIVASTPYIKENGYIGSETTSDPVSTAPISLQGVGEVRQASFITGSKGEDSTDYNGTSFSGGLDMSTIYGSDELRKYFPSLLPESYMAFGVATTTENGEISQVVLKLIDDTDGSYRDGMSEAEVFSLASTHDTMFIKLYKKNDANMRHLEGYTEKWDVTDTLSAKGIEAKYEDFYKTFNCYVDLGDVIMYYSVQERGVHGATVNSDALYRIITSTPAINVEG